MKYFIFFLTTIAVALGAPAQGTSKGHLSPALLSKYSVATFAAGCFWHEEALFESSKGVVEAVSGYAGGHTSHPTYESIETGNTGHAETVSVYYDPAQIDYAGLLKIYFAGQDPTQVNGQGPDRGSQYRSVVFYRTAAEKKQVEDYMKKLQPQYKRLLAVEVVPFSRFWKAEDYHQDFIEHNGSQGYVRTVSIPEIRQVQKQHPEWFKPNSFY